MSIPPPLLFINLNESEHTRPELFGAKLIPEQVIRFDDQTPFHEIEMYKKLVKYYIGLITRSMAINDGSSRIHGTQFTGSFPKQHEIDQTYGKCEGGSIVFPIKEDILFEHVGTHVCYFLDCVNRRRIYSVKNNETLFILFDVGSRFTAANMYSTLYEEDSVIKHKEENLIDYNNFEDMLLRISRKDIVIETRYQSDPELTPRQIEVDYGYQNKVSQLVLCGHSNGMGAATVTAYLLTCIQNNDYFLKNRDKLGDECVRFLHKMKQNQTLVTFLTNVKLFVVGSGGSPVLFDKGEFEEFYNLLDGRYVHIMSGFKPQTSQNISIDTYGISLYNMINIKYGLYFMSEIVTQKYKGVQCFDKVVINDSAESITESIISIENKDYIHSFKTYRNIISIYFFT